MALNDANFLDTLLALKQAELTYFESVQGIAPEIANVTPVVAENIDRLKHEIDYYTALKDGPVVMFAKDGAKGFKDLETAMAYLEAENIAAGRLSPGKILTVGPQSKKAIEKLIEEEGNGHA